MTIIEPLNPCLYHVGVFDAVPKSLYGKSLLRFDTGDCLGIDIAWLRKNIPSKAGFIF